MSLARRERLALVDAMTATGPDAPTLCEGWTTRDLAAHLVVRERRPDTAPGVLLKPLAGHTERVRRDAAKRPWPELLEQVRTGPPVLLRPFDAAINATEMFVHHEDVRRGTPGWSPRELGMADERELWSALRRMAKLSYRRSTVTVVLETPDGDHVEVKRPGDRRVVLLGRPSELLLHATGRNAVRLETNGAAGDIAAVGELQRGL
ncbi:MAG TPA: TIGR03085 family metal-binding protein [Aldersonia sp.]